MPAFITTSLFALEKSTRSSVILGLVGAGGIGFSLQQTIVFHRYPLAGTAIIVVVVATIAVDAISGWVRRRIIEGAGARSVAGDAIEEPAFAGMGAGRADTAAG
jgi:phosphonate transport system permease protein